MAVGVELVDGGVGLTYEGRPLALLDDLAVTLWGERHSVARGGLDAREPVTAGREDALGPHTLWHRVYTTHSLCHPATFELHLRLYARLAVIELVPVGVGAVFGQEEAASVRIGQLPDCRRGLFVHQRVTEYGRDAVGAWWAQAQWLPDPTRGNAWDWGLCAAARRDDGLCVALVPLCGGGAVSRLRGDDPGLSAVASGFCGRHAYARLPLAVLAVGEGIGDALDSAMTAAVRLSDGRLLARGEKGFPEPYEWLGYDTWGAFGAKADERSVDAALASLRSEQVPVRWLLLGEGWQQADAKRRLSGYDTDAERFPAGLRTTVQRLAGNHGLRHIGAWVAAQGCWSGLDPVLPVVAERRARFVTAADGCLLAYPSEEGLPFYREWLDSLSEAGLDFVKVDNLGSIRHHYLGRLPLGEAVAGTLSTLERAAAAAGLDVDLGMAVDPACWPHLARTNVMRVSADLHPTDVRAAKLHLAHSAMVGTWLSRVAWPDYDAVPTQHVAARALAVAAALSGGPVALCDRPGQTDTDLARRLVLADGRLLPPAEPGVVPDCWFFDDPLAGDAPLALLARPSALPRVVRVEAEVAPYPPPECLYLGVMNVRLDGQPQVVSLHAGDLPLPEADDYVVNLHFADERYVVGGDEPIELTLPELGAELLTIAPLRGGRALLGLPHKLLGASGCNLADDGMVSLPEAGPALLFDEHGAVPRHVDGSDYGMVDDPSALVPGTAWRSGPWLLVLADSTLFSLGPIEPEAEQSVEEA